MFTRARTDLRIMKTVFPEAERLALEEGLPEPGAEHLLLAAVGLEDGSALRALARVGVEPATLRQAIASQQRAALESVGVHADDDAIGAALPQPPERPGGVYRSAASAQALFQRVKALAVADRQPMLSAYFVLAAMEIEHGTIPRAFAELGVTRPKLYEAAKRELADASK